TSAVSAAAGPPVSLGMLGGGGGRRWLDAHRFLVDRTSPDFKHRTTAVVDIAGGAPKTLHEDVEEKFWSITGDAGANAQPSPDGTRLVYQHTDPHHSADLFVVDVPAARLLPQAYGIVRRLTDSMPASMDRDAFVEPEMVSYPGPDGKTVPAWLFVPKNLDRSK